MTKCLFVTSSADDYLSACLWDGLQEVLGAENVHAAQNVPSFCHQDNPVGRIGGTREFREYWPADKDYDLMVISTMYLREHTSGWPLQFLDRLRPSAKIAWVEGWDSAEEAHMPPTRRIDGVFRREINPGISYANTYGVAPCHHLGFAAPARWLTASDNNDRPIDVFAAYNHLSHPSRWDALSKMFQTRTKHRSLAASMGVDFEDYFYDLRHSKIALCPAGAADCVAMRAYEIAACGAIPLFVGHPVDRVRDPWFNEANSWTCQSVEELPAAIDSLLGRDLAPVRAQLLEHTRKWHTTAARVKRMLDVMGVAL